MSKSPTITKEHLHNPHAGEILLTEFLEPLALSQNALARAIGFPRAGSTKSCWASGP